MEIAKSIGSTGKIEQRVIEGMGGAHPGGVSLHSAAPAAAALVPVVLSTEG